MRKRGLCCVLILLAALTGCAREDAKTAYEAGCDALEAGQYEDAVNDFNETVSDGHYVAQAYRGAGLAQLYQDDVADACISFEKSLLNADDETDAFRRDVNLYLAHARIAHGETDKALAVYDTLLAQNPDAEVYFLRGKLNLNMDNTDAAKADFDRACDLTDDYEMFINIFHVYDDIGKSADGSRYLERALDAVSAQGTDYYDQGLIEYYLQNYQEAKDVLIDAIRADDTDINSIFLLGKVYLAMEDVPDARAVYEEHVSDSGMEAYAYNGLALCDMAEENYESALENVKAGIACGNDDASKGLAYNEIVINEKLHNWDEAKQLALQYTVTYPTDELGSREYQFLSSR